MGRFVGYDACPRCRARGSDRRGDNLARYVDGSAHCFACGFHIHPKHYVPRVKESDGQTPKAAVPRDFTREVPAVAWKWLMQYGLPYSYWKPYCGYSPAEERLILTVGTPARFSVGRFVGEHHGEGAGEPPRKWKQYGDRSRVVALLDNSHSSAPKRVVLVEDYISGHKVAQVAPSITLFGTELYPNVIKTLIDMRLPVVLWLDEDQYGNLPPKLNRLMTFVNQPVRFIRRRKDPKEYTKEEIKEILDAE